MMICHFVSNKQCYKLVTTKLLDSISTPLFVCQQMPLNYIDSLKEICLNIGLLEASLDGADLSCFAVLVQPSTKV